MFNFYFGNSDEMHTMLELLAFLEKASLGKKFVFHSDNVVLMSKAKWGEIADKPYGPNAEITEK